jgi:hypothetical protein
MAFIKKNSVMDLPREIFVDVPIDQGRAMSTAMMRKRVSKRPAKGQSCSSKGREGNTIRGACIEIHQRRRDVTTTQNKISKKRITHTYHHEQDKEGGETILQWD